MRHGGKVLVDQLSILGVTRVFSVPGESFLPVLDGLYDSGIKNVVCRHEGGAAMMAEATGKLTGTPGICFVTRGPGACNASSGVHVAMQDSTPMILFVGQINTRHRDREAFQEVDYRQMFGGLAKWVAEVDHAERLPEYVARAWRVAMAGRPGPVVLALPEDVLSAEVDVADFDGEPGTRLAPSDLIFADALDIIEEAERPVMVVGGPAWGEAVHMAAGELAQRLDMPVVTGFRRQDYVDNRHACFAGDLNVGVNPKLAARVREADCLVLIGTRFGDIETQGYGLVDTSAPGKRIVQFHSGAEELGAVYGPSYSAVCSGPDAVFGLLNELAGRDWTGWPEWRAAARADYEEWITPQESPGDVKQEQVIAWLSEHLSEDAIVTNGAGNYAAWLHRYFVYKQYGTQLAPTSGSMGYGFPAAVAASLAHPDRTVVCLAGDGCFQMTLNEMSTAVQYGAKPIVIVMNNGRYGTIRMHQEMHFPGRVSGTDMANPDFAALARAYGGHGEVVRTGAEFARAFERAQASGTLAVIECVLDPKVLATGKSLSD